MNPKLKVLLLIIFSTCTLFITDLFYMLIVFLSVIFSIFLLKIHSKLFEWIKPILIICVFIVLIQTFTYTSIAFSIEGLIFGITIALRLLSLLLVVFVFVSTTQPKELLEGFSFLPNGIALMLMLAFRLLPLVKREIVSIVNAQKTRGLNFKTLNIFKTYFPILVPLFARTLEGSNNMALAMESRGFEGK